MLVTILTKDAYSLGPYVLHVSIWDVGTVPKTAKYSIFACVYHGSLVLFLTVGLRLTGLIYLSISLFFSHFGISLGSNLYHFNWAAQRTLFGMFSRTYVLDGAITLVKGLNPPPRCHYLLIDMSLARTVTCRTTIVRVTQTRVFSKDWHLGAFLFIIAAAVSRI